MNTKDGTNQARISRDVGSELIYLTKALKAPALRDAAARLAERARDEGWSHEEYLAACLQREVAARDSHGAEGRIRAARFPSRKSLEEDAAAGNRQQAGGGVGDQGADLCFEGADLDGELQRRSLQRPPTCVDFGPRARTPATTAPRRCLCGRATARVIGSAAPATANSMRPCTVSPSRRRTITPTPAPTSSADERPATPTPKRYAPFSAVCPTPSTGPSSVTPRPAPSKPPHTGCVIDIGAIGRNRLLKSPYAYYIINQKIRLLQGDAGIHAENTRCILVQ